MHVLNDPYGDAKNFIYTELQGCSSLVFTEPTDQGQGILYKSLATAVYIIATVPTTRCPCAKMARILHSIGCALALLFSFTVLFPLFSMAAPGTRPRRSTIQTTIAQCEEIKCDLPDCPNPIRLDGECCPVCIQPGELL